MTIDTTAAGYWLGPVQTLLEGNLSATSGAHVSRDRIGPAGLTGRAMGVVTERFPATRTVPNHVIVVGGDDASAVGSHG